MVFHGKGTPTINLKNQLILIEGLYFITIQH
jgi:hypothetical protein